MRNHKILTHNNPNSKTAFLYNIITGIYFKNFTIEPTNNADASALLVPSSEEARNSGAALVDSVLQSAASDSDTPVVQSGASAVESLEIKSGPSDKFLVSKEISAENLETSVVGSGDSPNKNLDTEIKPNADNNSILDDSGIESGILTPENKGKHSKELGLANGESKATKLDESGIDLETFAVEDRPSASLERENQEIQPSGRVPSQVTRSSFRSPNDIRHFQPFKPLQEMEATNATVASALPCSEQSRHPGASGTSASDDSMTSILQSKVDLDTLAEKQPEKSTSDFDSGLSVELEAFESTSQTPVKTQKQNKSHSTMLANNADASALPVPSSEEARNSEAALVDSVLQSAASDSDTSVVQSGASAVECLVIQPGPSDES